MTTLKDKARGICARSSATENISGPGNGVLPSCSVVICTLDRAEELWQTVGLLLKQTINPKEIIIVDAGDLGSMQQELKEEIEAREIEFVYLKDRPSTTRQRNLGAEKASGEVLFFVDDDVDLHPGYLANVLHVYYEDKQRTIGGVTGINADVVLPRHGSILKQLFLLRERRASGRARMKRSNFPILVTCSPYLEQCDVMPSTAVSYRSDVFSKYRFDDSLDGYVMAEDLDLSYRVSREYALYSTPDAVFSHRRSTVSRNNSREAERRRIYFTQYFFKKNMAGSPLNVLCRYWALGGLALTYLVHWLRRGDPDLIIGWLEGVKLCWRRRLFSFGSLAMSDSVEGYSLTDFTD